MHFDLKRISSIAYTIEQHATWWYQPHWGWKRSIAHESKTRGLDIRCIQTTSPLDYLTIRVASEQKAVLIRSHALVVKQGRDLRIIHVLIGVELAAGIDHHRNLLAG